MWIRKFDKGRGKREEGRGKRVEERVEEVTYTDGGEGHKRSGRETEDKEIESHTQSQEKRETKGKVTASQT